MRVAALAALCLVAGSPGAARAGDQLELRLGNIAPEGTAYGRDCGDRFAAELRKTSGGRIRVKQFMGAMLGDERTMIKQAREGRLLQIAGVTLGAAATSVPELAAFDLPFLFRDAEDVDAVLRSPARAAVRRLLDAAGFHLMGMPEAGWRNFAGKRPLGAPATFEGLRVRSQDSAQHVRMWRLLGAQPRPLPITDVLSALEGGTVEALDIQAHFMFAASLHHQITHYTMSHHVYQGGAIFIGKAALAGQPPGTLRLVTDAWARIERGCLDGIRKDERDVVAELEKSGMKLVQLSSADREQLERRLAPLRDEFRRGTSPAGRALLGAIEKALEARRRR